MSVKANSDCTSIVLRFAPATAGWRKHHLCGRLLAGAGETWLLKKWSFYSRSGSRSSERVSSLHEEFMHAGSDVVEAFTYFGHREKLRRIGREDDLEKLNLEALRLAREVADKTGGLMAGNITKTLIYDPDDLSLNPKVKEMFKEQVEWAVKGGADFIIAETFLEVGEAQLALEVIKQYGQGLPSVITIAPFVPDETLDGIPIPQALRQLEERGADVVGLNCGRDPQTMLPLLREYRKICKGPSINMFPLDISATLCSREEVRAFAQEAKQIGIQYIGLCCGNFPALIREISEVYGKQPPSSKYGPDVSQSISVGDRDVTNLTPRQRKVQLHMRGR